MTWTKRLSTMIRRTAVRSFTSRDRCWCSSSQLFSSASWALLFPSSWITQTSEFTTTFHWVSSVSLCIISSQESLHTCRTSFCSTPLSWFSAIPSTPQRVKVYSQLDLSLCWHWLQVWTIRLSTSQSLWSPSRSWCTCSSPSWPKIHKVSSIHL